MEKAQGLLVCALSRSKYIKGRALRSNTNEENKEWVRKDTKTSSPNQTAALRIVNFYKSENYSLKNKQKSVNF